MTTCSRCRNNSLYLISFPKLAINNSIKDGTTIYKGDNNGNMHVFCCENDFESMKSIFSQHSEFDSIKDRLKYKRLSASQISSLKNLIN